MSSTSLLALATLIVAGSGRAGDVAPKASVVAVARAQIVSGVTLSPGRFAGDAEGHGDRKSKPHARRCPEDRDTPCRMIIVDMP